MISLKIYRLRKISIIFLSVVLSALFLIQSGSPVNAQTQPLLKFTPQPLTVGLNQTVNLGIEINSITNLYGFDITVNADPGVVEFVSIAQGSFLDPGYALINQVNTINGTAHFALTQLSPSTPKTGTGNLFIISVKGKTTGITTLTITNFQLVRADGSFISVDVNNGQMVVGTGGQTLTPTATVIFTPTRTVTPFPTGTPRVFPTNVQPTSGPTQVFPTTVLPTTVIPTVGTPVNTLAPTLPGVIVYPRNYSSPTVFATPTIKPTKTPVPTRTPRSSGNLPVPVTGDGSKNGFGWIWWVLVILFILLLLILAYGIYRNIRKLNKQE
jgi:hypothetical protein